MALASNAAQYTPPKHVQQMEFDLCRLPLLWAKEDDCLLTPTGLVDMHGNRVNISKDMKPVPWGWNKSVYKRFLHLGVSPSAMPTEQQLDRWRSYASRSWAADYCNIFYRNNNVDGFVPNHVSFLRSKADIEVWLSKHGLLPFIVKAEYSSSGRGNKVFHPHSRNTQLIPFSSQFIDTFYDKLLDFAMEFEVTNQDVHYLGLSVFEASFEGRYACNYIRSQHQLREMVTSLVNDTSVLEHLTSLHRQLLSEHLLGQYQGIVGIDMMVVRGGLIHPCVEINLRMNMGVVAMKLYEEGLTSLSRSLYGGHYFYPAIEDGKFFIVYSSNP